MLGNWKLKLKASSVKYERKLYNCQIILNLQMVCEKQKIYQYVHIWKLLVYISCKRLLSQFLKLDCVCVCELEHDYRITN